MNSHGLTDNGRLHDGQTGGANENDSEANTPVNEEAGVLGTDRVQDGSTARESHANGSGEGAYDSYGCESIAFTRG